MSCKNNINSIENNFKIQITIKLFLQITHQLRMRQIALKAKNVLKNRKKKYSRLPGSLSAIAALLQNQHQPIHLHYWTVI